MQNNIINTPQVGQYATGTTLEKREAVARVPLIYFLSLYLLAFGVHIPQGE